MLEFDCAYQARVIAVSYKYKVSAPHRFVDGDSYYVVCATKS